MAEFMINPRTTVVYEVLARHEEYIWARRTFDGSLETWHQQALEAYTPTPVVGEVWKSLLTGDDVVVVGRDEALGQWVTVPVLGDAWSEPVRAVGYAREELTPKTPGDEPEPVKEVAAEEPPTVATAKIDIVVNERQRGV